MFTTLTPEALQQYENNGYLVIENFCTSDEVDRLQRRTEDLIEVGL
jgi:hypothetical protein